MKKTTILSVLFAVMSLVFLRAYAAPPEITAETAVLIDATTGQVIYDKEMNKQMFPASITKIMTTILAVEELDLEEKLTVSQSAVDAVSRNASHIALTQGEEITVKEAIYAALLASANDACNVLAEAVSGDMESFAKLMTEKAREFGAKNTNFTNSNGLKDDNHYTSAYDMAMFTKYGLQNKTWRKMFGERRYEMPPTNKQKEVRYLNKQHVMIFEQKYYYEGIIGGKTGYTTVAKHTLVTAAERDGITLIAVVMKCPNNMDKYDDTKARLDYGFENFEQITLNDDNIESKKVENGDKTEKVYLEDPVTVLIPVDAKKEDIISSVEIKDGEAQVTFTLPENSGNTPKELGTFELNFEAQSATKEIRTVPKKEFSIWGVVRVVLIVVLSIIAIFALFVLIIYVRKEIYLWRRRRARRAKRRMRK